MFREDYQEKKSQKELSETFSLYLTKQQLIQSYPEELIPVRTQIVDWLIFLCHNLSFKTETLFRAISIFDLYISRQNSSISFYEVKLVAIASLSISTKIEEINCNFVQFLTDNVLNGGNQQIYTTSELTKKEIEILKTLNFNTNQSTSYQFLTIFHQICFNLLSEQPQTMNYILNMSENYLLLIIKGENSMSISPCEMAMLAINQTLFQLAYTFPNEKNRIIYCAISQVRSIANNYYAKNTEENGMSNNNYFQAVC